MHCQNVMNLFVNIILGKAAGRVQFLWKLDEIIILPFTGMASYFHTSNVIFPNPPYGMYKLHLTPLYPTRNAIHVLREVYTATINLGRIRPGRGNCICVAVRCWPISSCCLGQYFTISFLLDAAYERLALERTYILPRPITLYPTQPPLCGGILGKHSYSFINPSCIFHLSEYMTSLWRHDVTWTYHDVNMTVIKIAGIHAPSPFSHPQ